MSEASSASGSDEMVNYSMLRDRLQQFSEPAIIGKVARLESVLNALPSEIRQSLSEEERHHLEESVDEGCPLYLVTTNYDVTDFDQQFQRLKQTLAETGEVISTVPKVDDEHPDKIDFRVVYARNADLGQVKEDLIDLPGSSVTQVFDSLLPRPTRNAGIPDDEPSRPKIDIEPPLNDRSTLIRISLEDLDRLIASTHKLFRETTASLDRTIANLTNKRTQSELKEIAAGVSNSFIELAAATINLRMVSIDRVLKRAMRSGRAAALALGKEIDFIVTGRNLLLDKSLADAIADPLIHLVRNAVDHGIEDHAQRSQLGKSRRGSVRIEASTTQGQTRIKVTDDGRGVDPAVVSNAAVSLGVAQEGSSFDMEKSLRLIFRSGFSTAASVSGTSGRGVGLDVVESAVEQVGGEVRVSSNLGTGSSFEIRLPVTFGLMKVVVVTLADQRYLLDNSNILSSKPISAQEIEATKAGNALRLDGERLPLVYLRELLGQSTEDLVSNKQPWQMVCQLSKEASDGTASLERIVVVADSVAEIQQVLVQNLGSRGARWYGVAGAAELRDGTVALLLDLPRLIDLNEIWKGL